MRRFLVIAALGLVLGGLPLMPARAAAASDAPSVFTAEAEAWAYSVEVGIPGPVGPLSSHTTAAIDNSPHATGASGLADPGYLVRAAAQLVAGVPTPAYCESAWPEGPGQADCGAVTGQGAAESGTKSGAGPDATATASLGRVSPSDTAGALTIAAQSTTSSTLLDKSGVVRSTADVTLSGVNIAGGAIRIGSLGIRRVAAAGTRAAPSTEATIDLSGVTVAGTPVALGSDPLTTLADATKQAFGETLSIEPVGGHESKTAAGQISADSAGLVITFRPQPDRSVRIVLGYARVVAYANGAATAANVVVPPLAAAPAGDLGPSAPSAVGDVAALSTPALAPSAAIPTGAQSSSARPVAQPFAAVPVRAVRWVSPFMVLAQMTSGRQLWWFLFTLLPLVAGIWLARRAGMGWLAPWAQR